MSKQSSIEWLINCITEDHMIKAKSLNEWHNIFEQAKQMHKEEIEDAYGHGQNNGYMYAHQKAITITKENYYSQTYGGNNDSNR
jgi:hypothetical protein